jgi:lysophospholipase L1-like esterase
VALGDSYAAGLGTRVYYPSSDHCHRSPDAYPVLDAARVGARLRFRACSGATTGDVLADQVGALTAATSLVTVQVGGNDAGFRSVVTTCAEPFWAGDCGAAVAGARAVIANTLPGRLDTVFTAIRRAAPQARVVAVGYPRLFDGEDCNALTFFSPREEARLNGTADLLDAAIGQAAARHGFGFVDPVQAFEGHAICQPRAWLNGLSHPLAESFHPNRRGQAHYAGLVGDQLG